MSYVLVPRSPGPLGGPGMREADEVDQVVDDLFGVDDRGPTVWDAVLVAAGAGLVAWTGLFDGPSPAAVFGAAMLALGLILPIREAARWTRRRVETRRGLPLSIEPEEGAQLVCAAMAAREVSQRFGSTVANEVLSESHAALLDVASLTEGRSTWTAGERAYAVERIGALERVARALESAPAEAEPQMAAIHEIEQVDGSSVERLDTLAAAVSRSRNG